MTFNFPEGIRAEARPLARRELLPDQWLAVERLLRQLRAIGAWASEESEEPHEPRFLTKIDSARLNNVFLINGARGAGKTATLVTLLDVAGELARRTISRSHANGPRVSDLLRAPADGELYPERRVLDDSRVLILPLEVIDVRPLPTTRRLLPMLVGVLEPVVAALEPTPPLIEPGTVPPTETLRARFDRLMHAVTIGWSIVTPPPVSGELLGAEIELRKLDQWRRELVPAFRKFMTALSTAARQRWHMAPLFVLPIDDIDMNPARTSEALDLIRALHHPRIAYLLTGDVDLMKSVLTSAFMHELSPSRAAELAALETAGVLAVNHLLKVCPPEHTAELREMPWEARLDVLASRVANETYSTAVASLDSVLGRALPPYPRPLLAIVEAVVGELRKLPRSHRTAGAVDRAVAALSWAQAVESHEYGYTGWQRRLRNRITLERDNLRVDTAMFVPRGRVDTALSFRLAGMAFGAATRIQWDVVARGASITEALEVSDPTRASPFNTSTDIILPEQLAAAVRLAMRSVGDHGSAATFAARMSNAPHVAVTHFDDASRISVHLRWPTPQWRSVADALRFDEIFGASIEERAKSFNPDELRHEIATRFFAALVATFDAGTPAPRSATFDGALRALITASEPVLRDYVGTGLPVFTSPESGLLPDDANAVFRALPATDRSQLLAVRAAWLTTAMREQANDAHVERALARGAAQKEFEIFAAEPRERNAPSSEWQSLQNLITEVAATGRQRYGTEARRRLFESLSREVRASVLSTARVLARGRRGKRGAVYFAHELWRALAASPGSTVTIDSRASLHVVPSLQLVTSESGGRILELSPERALILAPVEIKPAWSNTSDERDVLRDFLYRLAWDESVRDGDDSDRKQGAVPFGTAASEAKPGATIEFPGLRPMPPHNEKLWFGPSMSALGFWEDLVDAWNNAVADAVEGRAPDEQQHYVDNLALRWASAYPDNPSGLRVHRESNTQAVQQIVRRAVAEDAWPRNAFLAFAAKAAGLSPQLRAALQGAVPPLPRSLPGRKIR